MFALIMCLKGTQMLESLLFCEVRDTPQSQHLLNCDRFSTAQVTSTPKPTPAPASLVEGQKCNIFVSQGDAAV
uniref:Uncharacterized protein n=1 Tax=Globisporangium ultimum (strain ATCC 200006 / CBS 805.95 / DAOM BR144) TaxID=431595 RepID=K3X304_GLOUD